METTNQDIERCLVCRESYEGANFTVLKFTTRKQRFPVVGPVKQIVLSPEVSLDSVLAILRSKNVPVESQDQPGR